MEEADRSQQQHCLERLVVWSERTRDVEYQRRGDVVGEVNGNLYLTKSASELLSNSWRISFRLRKLAKETSVKGK